MKKKYVWLFLLLALLVMMEILSLEELEKRWNAIAAEG